MGPGQVRRFVFERYLAKMVRLWLLMDDRDEAVRREAAALVHVFYRQAARLNSRVATERKGRLPPAEVAKAAQFFKLPAGPVLEPHEAAEVPVEADQEMIRLVKRDLKQQRKLERRKAS